MLMKTSLESTDLGDVFVPIVTVFDIDSSLHKEVKSILIYTISMSIHPSSPASVNLYMIKSIESAFNTIV